MLAEEAEGYYQRLTLFSKVNRLAVLFNNANPKSDHMTPIDLNDDEVLSFFKSLEDAQVQYLIVGGFAVAFHGYIRATNDLDLWLKDTSDNLEKLKQVLSKHGVKGLDTMRTFDLVPGFTQFAIGESGFLVDPMKSLKAFSAYDFDQCYHRAKSGEFKHVKFKVIDAQDLLKEKISTGRTKDQADIEHLKSLKK